MKSEQVLCLCREMRNKILVVSKFLFTLVLDQYMYVRLHYFTRTVHKQNENSNIWNDMLMYKSLRL